MADVPSDASLKADPAEQPESVERNDHLISQCLDDAAYELRMDFEGLVVLQDFASRLEDGICSQLPPGMDPDKIEGSPISELLETLADMVRVIELATAAPNVVGAPEPCGFPGEATMRARLGVKFAAQQCSVGITERLKNVLEQSSKTHGTAMKIAERCNDIGLTLRGSSMRVLTTLENCASLSSTIRHLAEQRPCVFDVSVTAAMRKKLEQAALTNCLNRFAAVSKDLLPVVTAVGKQVSVIREFTNSAKQEVDDAFELPFPMNLAQSILIGELPPLKKGLMRRLNKLGEINLSGMDAGLRQLSKNIDDLKVNEAQESLSNFITRAHTHLDKLDTLANPKNLQSSSITVSVPVKPQMCSNDNFVNDVVPDEKADSHPAGTYVDEAAQDMPPTVQATPSDVEGSLLATFNNSIMIDIADADETPVYGNQDEELETATTQTGVDASGFSPKMIEDQVSASVFQEAFSNWSPEAGTATPRSEEHTSGSASSSDQQADTPPLRKASEIFRDASEGCGL